MPDAGECDEPGRGDRGRRSSATYFGARWSSSPWITSVGTATFGSTRRRSSFAARAMARKPTGWKSRIEASNAAASSGGTPDENIVGRSASTKSLGRSSERLSACSQTLVGRIGRQRTGPTCVCRREGQRDGNRGVSVVERECERSAGRQSRDMGAVCADRVHETRRGNRRIPPCPRARADRTTAPRRARPSNHREVA